MQINQFDYRMFIKTFKIFNTRHCFESVIREYRHRSETGYAIADNVMKQFYKYFRICYEQTMPNQSFLTDNLQNFVNYPPKTTVGFAPKYTGNRRYFANMIGSPAFKEMLSRDVDYLRRGLIKKIKYCDVVTMDQALLKDFYHREVDQSR